LAIVAAWLISIWVQLNDHFSADLDHTVGGQLKIAAHNLVAWLARLGEQNRFVGSHWDGFK
jgi:hypothetical protein